MYKKIIIIISFVIIFGLGMLAGAKLKSKFAFLGDQKDTFQAGWDAAKERLAQSGIGGGISANMEIKNISGTVQKISGNMLTIKTPANFMDPLSDPSLDVRTVQVNGDTKFYQIAQKDPAQFEKEMQAFQKKMQEQTQKQATSKNINTQTTTIITPPSMQQDPKEIALSDIKEGQQVTITSSENIRNKAQFVATRIDVQVMPVVLQMPPVVK